MSFVGRGFPDAPLGFQRNMGDAQHIKDTAPYIRFGNLLNNEQ